MGRSFSARYGIIEIIEVLCVGLSLWRGWHTQAYQYQRESTNKPVSGFVACATTKENQPAFLFSGLVEPMEYITEEEKY